VNGWNLVPLYSIPRRTVNAQLGEPVPINWRRGLLRVWLLVSAAWIMGWVIYLIMYGLEAGFKASDVLVIPVLLLGPPVALLIFGIGVGWAFRGFIVDERR
jgi:hypothetical protein